MSSVIPETYGSIGPWQRYVAKEHAARDAYIATVQNAHREYLTGPWPDREAYQYVEQSAWVTYYAAGREAWRHYTRELTPPPPPPQISHDPDVQAAWTALEQHYGLNCLECGIPWRQPSPECTRMVHDVHPVQPAFTPNPETRS